MSVKHIGDLKKTECYGCSACVYSCSFGAITMERDSEGFRYPVVDEEKCTGCGKCRKICPSICPKDMSNAPEPESYAVWADDNIRRDSSSGGFFTILARSIFAQGGVVCGVVMDENFNVFHTVATNEKEFLPMRGSKYVQSDLRDIFPKVKEFLTSGKKVLFTGTPCQVAGLKAYLGGEEENLLTVIADNSKLPNSRWYTGSGIYRPVNLYLSERTHISYQGVKITTLSCKPAKIRISWKELTVRKNMVSVCRYRTEKLP